MYGVRHLLLIAMMSIGGCSLVVDFDRSLLVDAGADGGVDVPIDAGGGASADAEADAD